MVDREKLEADLNREWSWAMAQVRAHPKTATAASLIVGVVLGWLINAIF